jgi:hypothetical protein
MKNSFVFRLLEESQQFRASGSKDANAKLGGGCEAGMTTM